MNKPNEFQPSDLGEILFAAAVAQGRADALKAAAKKAAKDLAKVCRCTAYGFPHREDSGKCSTDSRHCDSYGVTNLNPDDALELALFDATEARAINRGGF